MPARDFAPDFRRIHVDIVGSVLPAVHRAKMDDRVIGVGHRLTGCRTQHQTADIGRFPEFRPGQCNRDRVIAGLGKHCVPLAVIGPDPCRWSAVRYSDTGR